MLELGPSVTQALLNCPKGFSVYIVGVANDTFAAPGQQGNKERQQEEH